MAKERLLSHQIRESYVDEGIGSTILIGSAGTMDLTSSFRESFGLASSAGFVEECLREPNTLVFSNKRSAKYIVVDKDETEHNIKGFVDNYLFNDSALKLPAKKPGAIISITGGAGYYQINSTLDRFVKRGFLKAAHNLGAWIVDGGMHAGVMKYVGNSIQSMDIKVPCIGVATLNKTNHWERLEKLESFEYTLDSCHAQRLSNLDPNHTNFILVKGNSKEWGQETGVVDALLEHLFHTHSVPTIVIALNGGLVTLEVIANGLEKGFPTIIIEGTGRACDAIASLVQVAKKYLMHHEHTSTCETLLNLASEDELRGWTKFKSELKSDAKAVHAMNRILLHFRKLTLFDPTNDEEEGLDITVLKKFLSQKKDIAEKIEACLNWGDTSEIVQEIIELDRQTKEHNPHEQALLVALLQNRPNTFNVLCDNHAVFYKPLKELYMNNPEVKRQLNRGHLWFFRNLSGLPDRIRDKYLTKSTKRTSHADEDFNYVLDILTDVGPSFGEYANLCSKNFATPLTEEDMLNRPSFIDLLIWAVFVNYMDLAKVIWRRTKFPVHTALLACGLYRFLSVRAIRTEEYLENASWFESEALRIMNSLEYEEAAELINFKSKMLLGDFTIEDLAADGECKEFMSHPHFQQRLDELLFRYGDRGIISSLSNSQLIVSVFIYFPVWLTIKCFQREQAQPPLDEKFDLSPTGVESPPAADDIDAKVAKRRYFYQRNSRKERSGRHLPVKPVFDQKDHDVYLSTHPRVYFNIPIVKFWTNSIFYILFLLFQSSVLLRMKEDSISVNEYLLWGWIASIAIAEVPQILGEQGRGYFSRFSNKMDMTLVLLHGIYVALRLSQEWTGAVNCLLIACVMSWLRLMVIFPVSATFGPLFFILARLVSHDLVLWGILFTIFAISFQIGFSSLALQAGINPIDPTFPDDNGTFPLSLVTIIGEWDYFLPVVQESPIGVVLLSSYSFIVQVMLVNLLIAMMGDTYATVRENSDVEWKYYRRTFVRDNMGASSLPPPLNIFILVRWIFGLLYKAIKRGEKIPVDPKELQDKRDEIAEKERAIANVMRKTVDKITEEAEEEEEESALFQIKLTKKQVSSSSQHGRKLEKHIAQLYLSTNAIMEKQDKLESIILTLAQKVDSLASGLQ